MGNTENHTASQREALGGVCSYLDPRMLWQENHPGVSGPQSQQDSTPLSSRPVLRDRHAGLQIDGALRAVLGLLSL